MGLVHLVHLVTLHAAFATIAAAQDASAYTYLLRSRLALSTFSIARLLAFSFFAFFSFFFSLRLLLRFFPFGRRMYADSPRKDATQPVNILNVK